MIHLKLVKIAHIYNIIDGEGEGGGICMEKRTSLPNHMII
jgi:hypothetical protein